MAQITARLKIEMSGEHELCSVEYLKDGEVYLSCACMDRAQAERCIKEINEPEPRIITMSEPFPGGYWVDENGEPIRWIPTMRLP